MTQPIPQGTETQDAFFIKRAVRSSPSWQSRVNGLGLVWRLHGFGDEGSRKVRFGVLGPASGKGGQEGKLLTAPTH